MRFRNLIVMVSAVCLSMCASTPEKKKSLSSYAAQEEISYDQYLVNKSDYTSSGKIYHEKYVKTLKGISKFLVTDKKIDLVKGSVGFYFDRKLSVKEDLYLGFDMTADSGIISSINSYDDSARLMIKNYYAELLGLYEYLDEIMKEDSVKGIVIGIKWKSSGNSGSVTLWTRKQDVSDYMNKTLTFKNLVYKTTVTNSDGKIVRIAL